MSKLKAVIKVFSDGRKELSIHDCPLWSFRDKFNQNQIENPDYMIKDLTDNYPCHNNHIAYLQEDYPDIVENASKHEEAAKIVNLRYDESEQRFYGDLWSTNQRFIDCVEFIKRIPRIHPGYNGFRKQVGKLKSVVEYIEFEFWLFEFDLAHIDIDIEYVEDEDTPTPKNDDECHPHPLANLKSLNPVPDIGPDEIKRAINTVLNRFADKIISEDEGPYSYTRLSGNHIAFKGPKIDFWVKDNTNKVDICAFVDTPVISVTSDGTTIIMDNNRVNEIKNLSYPSFGSWAKTLYDMLVEERKKGWTSREDTLKERLEKSEESRKEESDDKEDISNLIPKEELMKIIFENVKCILENDLSYHKYPWACPDNSWSLTSYDDSFRYVVYDRQNCVTKSIGCKLNKDHWEIYTEKGSNVNLVVYPDEARWMTDDILMRNPCKDFPTGIFEDIIKDINTWIKTKTMPNKELPAFSQRLIKDGKRPTKEEYYLAMAEVASTSGTCLRRRFGAVIVKNNRIVSTGYVGAPSGRDHCSEIGYCFREHHKIPSGTMYEKCRSTHAEMNAIIQASKEEMEGATLYLVGVEPDGSYTNADCCAMCKRVIINSGIEKVVAQQKNGMYYVIPVKEWVKHDDSLDINHKGY